MKTTLAFLLIAFSLTVFAEDDIVKETWTCRNNNLHFSVVLTEEGVQNQLSISYQYDKVSLELEAGQSYLKNGLQTVLVGEFYQGHDSYNYKATLVRGSHGKGKLVLISDMFLDCLGQRVETDFVNCQVEIERK